MFLERPGVKIEINDRNSAVEANEKSWTGSRRAHVLGQESSRLFVKNGQGCGEISSSCHKVPAIGLLPN